MLKCIPDLRKPLIDRNSLFAASEPEDLVGESFKIEVWIHEVLRSGTHVYVQPGLKERLDGPHK